MILPNTVITMVILLNSAKALALALADDKMALNSYVFLSEQPKLQLLLQI